MDAKTKLCFERSLELQLRMNGIVEGLCKGASMSPEDRKALTDAALRLTDALKRTKELITQ
jgi:hypothetical protein